MIRAGVIGTQLNRRRAARPLAAHRPREQEHRAHLGAVEAQDLAKRHSSGDDHVRPAVDRHGYSEALDRALGQRGGRRAGARPATGRLGEHEHGATSAVIGRSDGDRVAGDRDAVSEGIRLRSTRVGQLGLLDERIDMHRVRRAAVVKLDQQPAAGEREVRRQRPPIGIGGAQPAVAQLAAGAAQQHAPVRGERRAQRPGEPQRERQQPGAAGGARVQLEPLFQPERPVRPPFADIAERPADAVGVDARRDRADGRRVRSAPVPRQRDPLARGAVEDRRAGRRERGTELLRAIRGAEPADRVPRLAAAERRCDRSSRGGGKRRQPGWRSCGLERPARAPGPGVRADQRPHDDSESNSREHDHPPAPHAPTLHALMVLDSHQAVNVAPASAPDHDPERRLPPELLNGLELRVLAAGLVPIPAVPPPPLHPVGGVVERRRNLRNVSSVSTNGNWSSG